MEVLEVLDAEVWVGGVFEVGHRFGVVSVVSGCCGWSDVPRYLGAEMRLRMWY